MIYDTSTALSDEFVLLKRLCCEYSHPGIRDTGRSNEEPLVSSIDTSNLVLVNKLQEDSQLQRPGTDRVARVLEDVRPLPQGPQVEDYVLRKTTMRRVAFGFREERHAFGCSSAPIREGQDLVSNIQRQLRRLECLLLQ